MTPPKPLKKKPRGRPRVTRAVLDARIADYCSRHEVEPTDSGLPPFPTGKRETAQHRKWLGLYKAHSRLVSHMYPEAERRATLDRQDGRCPVCARDLDLEAAVNHADMTGAPRGVLHEECKLVAVSAERLGVDGFDRLRAYLFR